jgi:large subunit ribosomal protein L20
MKRRRNVLKQVKGYRFGRSTKEAAAKEAIAHAGTHAFRDRRVKKRTARGLWNVRINAAVRDNGITSYSVFMGALKKKGSTLNRKMLADLAKDHPEVFKRVAEHIMN